jgi:hypothetical protein
MPGAEIKSVWQAQGEVNEALADGNRATFDLASTVAKSLARTQDQVKRLWALASLGWLTSVIALIAVVVR